MKTKVIFLYIGLFVFLSNAFAQKVEIDGIAYNLSSDLTASVTFKFPKYSGDITIPSTITYSGFNYRVTSIGNYAFKECSGLTSITIPNSVTSIGYEAFLVCDSLTSITIPNSVTSIGKSAFESCSGLTSITIPISVTSIGTSAFLGCDGLTSIIVESGNSVYDSRNNCNAIIETSTNKLITGCKNTVIPNSVTSIGYEAFCWCESLTSITIPNSVTSIGTSAFSRCTRLTSITIPNSVTSIGLAAFSRCTRLTSITIPNSVTEIDDYAFKECSGLTSITIPYSVTFIGSGAFSNCSGLTSITVESGNSMYDSRNNCNAIIKTSTNNLIEGCKNTIIPNSVTSIENYAFYGCSGLTSITIPNSVTSIGEQAFYDCDGLTSITIPNSVTFIGSAAFKSCSGLTSITIPNSVTSIGNSAFYDCDGLTSITIPNSVISIGKYAFRGCSGLTSITIPNSVTYMGDYVFPDNGQLSYIFVDNPIPPTVNQTSSYSSSFYNGVNLYVPAGSINAYRNASFWGNFLNINPPPSVTVHANHGDATISYQSLTEAEVLITPHYGYHFTQWSDGNTDNPRSVIVAQNATYTAEFAKNSYQVVVKSSFEAATLGTDILQVEYLDTVVVSAMIPEPCYRFVSWDDGVTENPRTEIVTENLTFNAVLSNLYQLSASSEHGTITGAGEYPYGSYVMLAVIPDNGYKFVRWSDGTIYNPYSLVLEKDFSVEAIMEPVASEVDEHESEDHSAKKIMKDGVIYIIKNGKTYNLYGTLIERTE